MSLPANTRNDYYADIIIDISHEALDRVFQYRIPGKLQGRVAVGSRVTVPFGAANRKTSGYVIALKEEPDIEPERVKDILEVEDESLSVETQLIRLAGFLKDRYGSSMIQSLRTVVPVRSRTGKKTEVYIYPALSEAESREQIGKYEKRHAVNRAALLEGLLEKGFLTRSQAAREYHISFSDIKKMVSQGILVTTEEVRYRNPYLTEPGGAPRLTLNEEQKEAVDLFNRDYTSGNYRTYLLYGITGSGKTEVYLSMVRRVIAGGRQAIVLVPEISLTWQTVRRFCDYFGDRIAVLNSRLSKGERFDAAERIRLGQVDVVIGPRSALFAPVRDPGIIIIDEEHDPAFKSDQTPKYHTTEVAAFRARIAGASLVLGSATPLVESYEKALTGQYQLLRLTKRAGGAGLPKVSIVDLRQEFRQGNRSVFSGMLADKIRERLAAGEQTMLFINRRGFAGFVSCRSCGYVPSCPHCDVSLTYHRDGSLRCHYCGYETEHIRICPVCGSPHVAAFGMGTEKIEAAVYEEFPEARVLRMDADTTRRKHAHKEILTAFSEGEADILIGTQMIVKGHDVANVTLVGVIAADLSLFGQDFRSGERTFELLCQAAGRAGRGNKAGEVVIQTYHPDHYAITAASRQSYDTFFENEAVYRKMMGYPPYGHILVILIQGDREEEGLLAQERIRIMLMKSQQTEEDPAVILNPGPAMISRIKDVYRHVLYIKHRDKNRLSDLMNRLGKVTQTHEMFQGVSVTFDLDPMKTY